MAQVKETKVVDGKPAGMSPSSSGLIQTLEGGVLTKRSSRIASRKDGGDGQSLHAIECALSLLHTCYVLCISRHAEAL